MKTSTTPHVIMLLLLHAVSAKAADVGLARTAANAGDCSTALRLLNSEDLVSSTENFFASEIYDQCGDVRKALAAYERYLRLAGMQPDEKRDKLRYRVFKIDEANREAQAAEDIAQRARALSEQNQRAEARRLWTQLLERKGPIYSIETRAATGGRPGVDMDTGEFSLSSAEVGAKECLRIKTVDDLEGAVTRPLRDQQDFASIVYIGTSIAGFGASLAVPIAYAAQDSDPLRVEYVALSAAGLAVGVSSGVIATLLARQEALLPHWFPAEFAAIYPEFDAERTVRGHLDECLQQVKKELLNDMARYRAAQSAIAALLASERLPTWVPESDDEVSYIIVYRNGPEFLYSKEYNFSYTAEREAFEKNVYPVLRNYLTSADREGHDFNELGCGPQSRMVLYATGPNEAWFAAYSTLSCVDAVEADSVINATQKKLLPALPSIAEDLMRRASQLY